MINPSRRSLIIGIGASLIAAPAIVRASSLMKVKPAKRTWTIYGNDHLGNVVSEIVDDGHPMISVERRNIQALYVNGEWRIMPLVLPVRRDVQGRLLFKMVTPDEAKSIPRFQGWHT